MKANPFQTHPNPFFHAPIPVFGRISRIFDKFRTYFLCKANPFSKMKIKDLQPITYSLTKSRSYLLESSLARNLGSSARLLPLSIPESYSCTSRIRQRQVTKQLTKITAKNNVVEYETSKNTKNYKQSHFAPVQHQKVWCWDI